jgi:hypothetical protein
MLQLGTTAAEQVAFGHSTMFITVQSDGYSCTEYTRCGQKHSDLRLVLRRDGFIQQ